MFHILWAIVVGFVVGLIARAVMPGVDHMGFWMTAFLGIGGSIVGGIVGALIRKPTSGTLFHPAGFVMSIVGAVFLLWAVEHFHLV